MPLSRGNRTRKSTAPGRHPPANRSAFSPYLDVGRRPATFALALSFALTLTAAPVRLQLDASEAEQVLAIPQKQDISEADWQRLFETEPYVRLKKREAAMNRAFTDAEFRAFVLSPEVAKQRAATHRTLELWKKADMTPSANACSRTCRDIVRSSALSGVYNVAMQPQRLAAVLLPLLDDLTRCFNELSACADTGEHSQFWSRTCVRSLFAAVEAAVYELRLVVLAAARAGRISLGDNEIAALSDHTFEIDARGHVISRPRYVPMERHLRFVFTLLVRVFGNDVALATSDHRFGLFKQALAVRNRIMHPKDPSDIVISLPETQASIQGFLWFRDALAAVNSKWHQELTRSEQGDAGAS